MESKAFELRNGAEAFKKDSGELKSMSRCRNFKICCVVFTIALVLVLVIVVPIIREKMK